MLIAVSKKTVRKAGSALLCFGILFLGIVCIKNMVFVPKIEEAATDNWGLSFQEEGKAPVGNADAAYLKKFDAYYVGNPSKKEIYLTFDAGFENGCTEKILDTLKKHHVKAAFFVVGNYIVDNPELVKRMNREGHIVGNHTNTHPDMSAISTMEKFEEELTSLEKKYQDVTGKKMSRYYRPPQGKYNEDNLKMAQQLGYRTILWSLAYVDWLEDAQPPADEAIARLTGRIHPGAVVLLHSTSQTNAEILDSLLTKWEQMGYEMKSISELHTQDVT